MQKLPGDSPLRVIIMAFVVIFFVTLFVWQIGHYLEAGKDSKIQGQISKMNLMIEADSLEADNKTRFAYLHSTEDIAKPLTPKNKRAKFKPTSTLTSLFVRNHFSASITGKNACYVYLYFPPGTAKDYVDTYPAGVPAYVLAGWSDYRDKVVASTSPGLDAWAKETLKASHFYCEPKNLRPNVMAKQEDGTELDLPGLGFQFSGLYYSKIKQ